MDILAECESSQTKEPTEQEKKIYMTEKRIKQKFMREHMEKFGELMDLENPKKMRLYAFEFPVRTTDGEKYADVLLENDIENTPMKNQMWVLEFKSKKVDYQSAVAQVLRYADTIQKQLYRHNPVIPIVVAPDFSNHELLLAKKLNVTPVIYEHKTGYMKIISS